MGRKKIDLTGQRFGNWTVLGECEERSKSGRILWECSCDCGTQSNVPGVRLKSGSSRSCGCLGESKHLVATFNC